ncbi:MAG: rhodanese-like domain-containing protein [Asgard group archaeon]|nr:rhodanese-like domain-containing protein [Asgard group archaeon]
MIKKTKKGFGKLSKLVLIGILGLLLTSFIQLSAQDYVDISVEEAKLKIDTIPDIFILDVRSTVEYYDEGHIQGAVNINVYFLKYNLDKLPTELDTEIIVYCDNGIRSKTAAEYLTEDYNYTNVFNMEKGMNEWKKKGYPYIIGTDPTPTSQEVSGLNLTASSLLGFIFVIFSYRILVRRNKN